MSFLIIAGLFLCYEVFYDRIIDREQENSGLQYMLIHLFLIFGMNLITTSLEFMRDEAVRLWPKVSFLIGAFLLFFLCLFALLTYAKPQLKRCRKYVCRVFGLSILFAGLMAGLGERMDLNILVTVLFVYGQYLLLRSFLRHPESEGTKTLRR